MTRHIEAGLDLLDRQILDSEGTPVGKVDDLELNVRGKGDPPEVVALLLGTQAQGPRVGGRIGEWMARIGGRIAGTSDPRRIPLELVAKFDVSIHLNVPASSVSDPSGLEAWLSERFVKRIPGGRRASG